MELMLVDTKDKKKQALKELEMGLKAIDEEGMKEKAKFVSYH